MCNVYGANWDLLLALSKLQLLELDGEQDVSCSHEFQTLLFNRQKFI